MSVHHDQEDETGHLLVYSYPPERDQPGALLARASDVAIVHNLAHLGPGGGAEVHHKGLTLFRKHLNIHNRCTWKYICIGYW